MTQPIDPTISQWGNTVDPAEAPCHGIDETVTGGAFASVRDGAWHGLGTVWLPEQHDGRLPTSRELLREAKCDFPIYTNEILAQVERRDSEGLLLDVEIVADNRRVNLLRDHPETGRAQILGQVGKGYPLWTPEEILCGFGDGILQYGEPTVSTCGALDEGRQVFMAFKLPKDIKVGGLSDEMIQLYLVTHTSFDGSTATTARLTSIRTVCRNTLEAGKRVAVSEYRIRKTRNAKLAVIQAQTALGLVAPYLADVQAEADAMITTRITKDQFQAIITKEFGPGEDPSKKAVAAWAPREQKLMELFTTADTQANVRDTAWGAFNAVVEYADWEMNLQGSKGMTDQQVATGKFKRSLFGDPTVVSPKIAARRVFRDLSGLPKIQGGVRQLVSA
jgi:phage/plasmid-like protein (TIGR03299 family)